MKHFMSSTLTSAFFFRCQVFSQKLQEIEDIFPVCSKPEFSRCFGWNVINLAHSQGVGNHPYFSHNKKCFLLMWCVVHQLSNKLYTFRNQKKIDDHSDFLLSLFACMLFVLVDLLTITRPSHRRITAPLVWKPGQSYADPSVMWADSSNCHGCLHPTRCECQHNSQHKHYNRSINQSSPSWQGSHYCWLNAIL